MSPFCTNLQLSRCSHSSTMLRSRYFALHKSLEKKKWRVDLSTLHSKFRLPDYFRLSGAASAVGAAFGQAAFFAHSVFCGHSAAFVHSAAFFGHSAAFAHSAHFSAGQAGLTSSTFGHSAFAGHCWHSTFGWQQGSPQAPCFLGCPQQEIIATDARAIIANDIIFFIIVKNFKVKKSVH